VDKKLLFSDAKNALQLVKIRSILNARFHDFVELLYHHIKTTKKITTG
jgi:5'-deoxynucleotidase YfbR-like HD superfamily hydrolase